MIQDDERFIFIPEGVPGKQAATRILQRRLINHHPNVSLPFPPKVTPEELVLKPKRHGVKSKAANCFLIYRQLFVRELQQHGHQYAMTDISKFISDKWRLEQPNVKQYYKNLAQNANKLHKKEFGDVPVPTNRRKNNSKKGRRKTKKTEYIVRNDAQPPQNSSSNSQLLTQDTNIFNLDQFQNNPPYSFAPFDYGLTFLPNPIEYHPMSPDLSIDMPILSIHNTLNDNNNNIECPISPPLSEHEHGFDILSELTELTDIDFELS